MIDMSDGPPRTKTPPISALLGQLAADTKTFARAEAAYLSAQAGERVSYVKPAVIMIGAGAALAIGSLLALPFGLMLLLSLFIGPIGAVAAVTIGLIAIGAILIWLGVRRIKAALKRPEDR